MSTGPVPRASYEIAEVASTRVDPRRLALLLERCRLEVETGSLPSAQVAVACDGRLVAFETFGDASSDAKYILQSVGRTVVAATIWKVIDEGLLELDQRVGEVIPEFGANGKEDVTVRHVLTHTAGFPFAPLGHPKFLDRARRLEAMSRWHLDDEPGTKFQFHLTGAAWVIAELVQHRTGLTFSDYLQGEILRPLGIDLVLPLPEERYGDVLAVPEAIDRTIADQEPDPWGPWYLVPPPVLAGGEPSHSIVGSAADMALFLQSIVHSGLWSERIVAEGTRIQLEEPPVGEQLYGGDHRRTAMGLFLTIAGADRGSWAPVTGSSRTFGNGGAPCQLAFMDPDTGTSFAFLTNGYPLKGYDFSALGTNRILAIGALGNDLVASAEGTRPTSAVSG